MKQRQYYPKRMRVKCNKCGKYEGNKYHYVWHCACAGGIANHYTLTGDIWDSLCGKEDFGNLIKSYRTYEDAIDALRRAIKNMQKNIDEYSNIKENE